MLKITATAGKADHVVYRLTGDLQVSGLKQLAELFGEARAAGKSFYIDLSGVVLADRASMEILCSWVDTGVDIRHCPPYLCKWMDQDRCR